MPQEKYTLHGSALLFVALATASITWGQPPLPVVGTAQDYALVPDTVTATFSEGRYRWQERVHVAGATFLKIHFVDFELRPGDRLSVSTGTGHLVETLTSQGPKDLGAFWGLSGRGDELFLELDSNRRYREAPFRIDEVIVGLQDLLAPITPPPTQPEDPESICAPPDFEDVICYQGDPTKWANVQASVGVMSVGGNPNNAIFCSGSNLDGNNVLTNNHCVSTQSGCDNTEFVFRFWRTGCNDGSPPTKDWLTFRCDELLVTQPFVSCDQGLDDLDFSLFSVIGDPAATFGSVTPDPNPLTDGEAIYIVQHPAGRPHEVTHGDGVDVDVDGTVLRYYDTLDTEGGSSGSPLYREADGLLVGLHHCGGCSTPGTGNRGMLMSDIYPHIEEFVATGLIFADGFESGDISAWSTSAP